MGTTTWGVRVTTQMESFEDDIDKTLSQYSTWLDSDTVDTLQDLQDSTLTLVSLPLLESSILEVEAKSSTVTQLLGDIDDRTATHIGLLTQLINEFENSNKLKIRSIADFKEWKENISPSPGSGNEEIETKHPSDG